MSIPFKGTVNIDIKDSTPDWAPYAQPVPPEGADAEREFDYTSGAEKALDQAAADGWTVVSVRDDWATVF
jgi:hypothetical protein